MGSEAEYLAHVHGMQAGVGMKMHKDGGPADGETSPKHLRVGVNAAMSDHAALFELLKDKGLLNEEEYLEYRVKWMKREKESYEQYLSEVYGSKVTLK